MGITGFWNTPSGGGSGASAPFSFNNPTSANPATHPVHIRLPGGGFDVNVPYNASSSPDAFLAEAQAQGSQGAVDRQTGANRPNINTQFGSQSWSKDANGNWTLTNNLDPRMQGALGSLYAQMDANYSKPFDDGSAARDQAIKASYGQATSRLDPRFAHEQEQLGSQLAQQGLDPNSQAYRTSMQQESQNKNDAYTSAMNSAIGQGNAAGQQVFNQNMQARNMPMQELMAMQGFGNMPGFNFAGQAQGPNYLGAREMQFGMDSARQARDDNNSSQTWGAIGNFGAQLGSKFGAPLFNAAFGTAGAKPSNPDYQPGGPQASQEGDYPTPRESGGDEGGSASEQTALRMRRPFSFGPSTGGAFSMSQ